MRLGEFAWDHISVDNGQADRILESANTHSAQRVAQTENPLGEKKMRKFQTSTPSRPFNSELTGPNLRHNILNFQN